MRATDNLNCSLRVPETKVRDNLNGSLSGFSEIYIIIQLNCRFCNDFMLYGQGKKIETPNDLKVSGDTKSEVSKHDSQNQIMLNLSERNEPWA